MRIVTTEKVEGYHVKEMKGVLLVLLLAGNDFIRYKEEDHREAKDK